MHNFTRCANDVDNSVDIDRRKCVRMCAEVRADVRTDTCANAYVDKRARGVRISMWGSCGRIGEWDEDGGVAAIRACPRRAG
ncbi:hypothetical protein F8277_06510 [Bifidobacterium longum subsp. infantis]|nr:hypothetical protein F8277_06510 [Bifidobacterium longum subsp. infantis]MED7620007.1 hypothetical protein [Bifidobacterium longum subsp. infantis]MSR95990.1 hypothetical protein [Bifidobacterium sp. WCA-178-WT-4B]